MLSRPYRLAIAAIAIVLVGVALLPGSWSVACSGCVDLDELNFDRTVARFPYALLKFDIAFPYGEKHESFGEFSRAAHKVTKELLIATVGIKDYGEMENKQLGLRFGIDDKSFPGILLFRGGSVGDYLRFPSHLDITVDNLKRFVTEHTTLFIGRDGCVKPFEELIHGYANFDEAAQQQALSRAAQLGAQLSNEYERQSAKIYETFMRKISSSGYVFVETETKRLQRLRAGKVSEAKKVELTQRLNILESFRVTKLEGKTVTVEPVIEANKQDL